MRPVHATGLAGSALLLLSGLVYARVPTHSRLNTWRVHAGLAERGVHLWVGVVIGALGLVLLTVAWVWLCRIVRTERSRRLVWTAVTVWTVPLLLSPPLFSGDVWSYVGNGFLTGHGQSPYVVHASHLPEVLRSAVNRHWLHTPSPYGPLAQLWGAIPARVTMNPWLLLAWQRVLALFGLVLLAWATPRLAERAGRDPAEASALVLASPFLLVHGIGGVHNDLLTAGLVLAALAVTRPGRWVAGAVLTGLAASVKVTGGLVGIGVVLLALSGQPAVRRRLVTTAEVATVALGVVVGLGWVIGVGVGWVQALSVPLQDPSWLAPVYISGRLLVPMQVARAVGVLVVVCAAVLLLLRGPTRPHQALLWTGGLLLLETLCSPEVHYWYFLWSLPLLACVALTRPAAAALTAFIGILGLMAVADAAHPELHHIVVAARYTLLLVPLLAWVSTRSVVHQQDAGRELEDALESS